MVTINIKQLRDELPRVIREVKLGKRFTVTQSNRPVFDITPPPPDRQKPKRVKPLDDPMNKAGAFGSSGQRLGKLKDDPIYRVKPLSRRKPARRMCKLEDDPLYRMNAVGRSTDGLSAARDHDKFLYGT